MENEDCLYMKNPNLYITLPESENNGYVLREDGGLLLMENVVESILLT